MASNDKQQYIEYAKQKASELGLDPSIVEALILQESGGNPNAVSSAGAKGIMQIMPSTAKQMEQTGLIPNAEQVFTDPKANIEAGLKYLKQQLDTFGSYDKALAAYNAGPGNVNKALDANGNLVLGKLPKETQNYVPSILNRAGQPIPSAALGTGTKGLSTTTQPVPQATSVIPLIAAGTQQQVQGLEKQKTALDAAIQALEEARAATSIKEAIKAQQRGNIARASGVDFNDPNNEYGKLQRAYIEGVKQLEELQRTAQDWQQNANIFGNLGDFITASIFGNPYDPVIQRKQQEVQTIATAMDAISRQVNNAVTLQDQLNAEYDSQIADATQQAKIAQVKEELAKLEQAQGKAVTEAGKTIADVYRVQGAINAQQQRLDVAQQRAQKLSARLQTREAKLKHYSDVVERYGLNIDPEAAVENKTVAKMLDMWATDSKLAPSIVDSAALYQQVKSGELTPEEQVSLTSLAEVINRAQTKLIKTYGDPKKIPAVALDSEIIKELEAQQAGQGVDEAKLSMYSMLLPKAYLPELDKKDSELAQAIASAQFAGEVTSPKTIVEYLNGYFNDLPQPDRALKIAEYFNVVVEHNNEKRGYGRLGLPKQKGFVVAKPTGSFFGKSMVRFDFTNPEDVVKFLVLNDKEKKAKENMLPSVLGMSGGHISEWMKTQTEAIQKALKKNQQSLTGGGVK